MNGIRSRKHVITAILIYCLSAPILSPAQTVYFNTSDPGQVKSIEEWGVDTAWPSRDNMRISIAHMGLDAIDIVRLNFYMDEPLTANGQIAASSRPKINNQLNIAAMAGDKPLMLTPATGDGVDPWYKDGSQVRPDRWVQLIEATQEYINRPIASVEPFNEPDYSPWNQGTPANLYDILGLLQNSPNFQGTLLGGASVLNSDTARSWYDHIKSRVTLGTTHQLAGSTNSYVNFIQYVKANGDIPHNPELHSLAEAIYGAEYGLGGGIWWGAVTLPRGLFVRVSDGRRLGYAENRGRYSSAAVYRAPDGQLYGFAGCFERQGSLTPYRFVCTDRDVYYNGIGPIREFMINIDRDQDAYIYIDYDEPVRPALDGNRWKIVNRHSGRVLEVANAGTSNGADIRQAIDTDALHQKWDIVREKSGYYKLFAAHSGRTAEVANWSTSNGGNIRQWGMGDNSLQTWFIEEAGAGYFYIRNAHSCKYMTADGNSVNQWDLTGSHNQQWQFVEANPPVTGTLTSYYEFENNANDSTGSGSAIVSGSPEYPVGRIGRAIQLNGVGDHLTLPSGIADTDDITIAAWINWNGGSAWQRVFDFGNGTGSYMFLSPRSGSNTMRFAIVSDDHESEEILDTDPLPTDQWVHVVITLSGNTGIMYINGSARVAGQIRLNPSDINPAINYIGRSQFNTDPYYNGLIDDFRIYNYALDQQAIMDLYLMITPEGPYDGQPYAIPGRIEAEHYDHGGQNVGYYDTTTGNSGGAFRLPTDVDIYSIMDGRSAFAVGDIETGEWLRYTVNSTAAETEFYARIASDQAGGQILVWLDEELIATVEVPNTGSLDAWQTVTVPCQPLPDKENAKLVIEFIGSGFRLNWFRFGNRMPYLGVPFELPGQINAEDFDIGGQDISYYSKSDHNGYGFYRPDEPVDILHIGGVYLVFIGGGEWLEYTCNIEPGYYTLVVRNSVPYAAQEVLLSIDGQTQASFTLPSSGAFFNWQQTVVPNIYLPGGQEQHLRLSFLTNTSLLDHITFYREYNVADITQSGRVDIDDFAVLAAQWLGAPGTPSADIAPLPDGDGVVDILDLILMAENWLYRD